MKIKKIFREEQLKHHGKTGFIATVVLAITASLLTAAPVCGGEIYTYQDKSGNTVISNTPVPEHSKGKVKILDTYKKITTEERESLEKAEEAANEERKKQKEEAKEMLNKCLAAAESAYSNAVRAECQRHNQSEQCTLNPEVTDFYKSQMEAHKTDCRNKYQ